MTKKSALERAIAVLSTSPADAEAVETLNGMVEQLDKARTPMSDEKKKELSDKRKAATAEARKALLDVVVPVVRGIAVKPMTAKEIYAEGTGAWPADFSVAKLQNILIREMAPELDKVEAKGKPNTYCIKG